MIRHAEAAAFPVGPLPVAVIEPSLPALLVSPFGGSQLLPPRFFPAALAAVSVAPVTMAADPEHRATVGPPAKPLTQWRFAGAHRRPSGGTGQPRLGMGSSILSTGDVRSFFRVGAKNPIRRLTVGIFPSRLRPHPTRASAGLGEDDGSISHYRRASKNQWFPAHRCAELVMGADLLVQAS